MKKHIKNILTLFCLLGFLVMPYFVFADAIEGGLSGATTNLGNVASAANLGNETDVMTIIANIINIILGFLGIICVILVLMAGFNWMTAAGNSEKIDKAKDTLRAAIIGLIIIIGAYSIASFAINAAKQATGN